MSSTYQIAQSDVVVQQDGETTYLTTLINEDSTPSAETRVSNSLFTLPQGFISSTSELSEILIKLVIIVAVVLVFFQLIMAGFGWITAGSDKSKTDNSKNRIIAALVGLLIMSASYVILQLAVRVIGFSDISEVFNLINNI